MSEIGEPSDEASGGFAAKWGKPKRAKVAVSKNGDNTQDTSGEVPTAHDVRIRATYTRPLTKSDPQAAPTTNPLPPIKSIFSSFTPATSSTPAATSNPVTPAPSAPAMEKAPKPVGLKPNVQSRTNLIPMAPSYQALRREIMRQVHADVMAGSQFADVEMPLCTRRTKAGKPYGLKTLSVNRKLLSAASAEYARLLSSAEPTHDGYAEDSDLEEDLEIGLLSSKPMNLSSPNTAVDAEGEKPKEIPPIHVTTLESESPFDGAYKTWQALALYLYDPEDHIAFTPLRSFDRTPLLSNTDHGEWRCSPKSMYRLAHKLKLKDLQAKAQKHIEANLTADNIVHELFSDFTWRYQDILRMETDVFHQLHSRDTNGVVDDAMEQIFERIAAGELPHSSGVLKSLFTSLVRSGKDVST
ncbi:hypothetical protein EIP91_008212 [Steccherinum ochraceum]|uniref:Uncharacterized protein n=1 Tax=Steccherinum ochraceum TaxID=92696 RepID=A0A4V6N792_9APHY|nr:hypothetical protein EIP91_008212 [Steccherinum ochraceum]